ncbi:sugar kinase [Mollicutes bacterium LVI A0039]|nr:sugar kinase [Mollicutes bacterium LVI A0039]
MKVIALGEVMMRLSQPENVELNRANNLSIYFGGGEYNTLVNLAGLGHQTEIVTSLPNNQLTTRIFAEAKTYGVGTKFTNITEGRLGTYYAILGDNVTPTQVIYDRADSCFANSSTNDYNFDSIFAGADLFHVSGITAALNEQTKELTLEAIKYAKSKGIAISYDSNYRAKLWTQAEAGEFMRQVLPLIDYAFLGLLDIKYLLNIDTNILQDGYELLKKEYPNIKLFASTNREVVSPTIHKLKVNIYDTNLYTTDEITMDVKDRIGGGDVFTGGVLDGILLGKDKEEIAKFALADAAIKHQRYGDNCFITRQEVEAVSSGSSLAISR